MKRYLPGAGFLGCWRTRVLLAVLVVVGSVPTALTQSGFLNIDCGTTSSYVDSATGLSWEPDAPYISAGKTRTVTLPTSLQNFTEMQTLRYFDDARAKNCYALPVTHNASYLLKLTFFYGNYDTANLPPTFQVAIDANIVSNVIVNATAFSYTEYHYMSRGNFTFVCFLRTSPGATPFISGISLKQAKILADDTTTRYRTQLQYGIIMSTVNRVNFGGSTLIRAPADYFDRFWIPEGPTSFYYLTPQTAPHEFLSTSTSLTSLKTSWPPSAAMQTAVTSSSNIQSYLLPEGSSAIRSSFFLYLYFVQLNSSANPPQRNFTIKIPAISTVESTADLSPYNDFLDYTFGEIVPADKLLDTSATLILTPLFNSEAGPILNCMEIYATSEERVAKTGARNALAIEDIKKSYNLTEWTGDPCLPFPHAWITCSILDPTSNAPEPAITAVNLSGYRLVGTLQASFANLRDLTSLDLSNNGLSGPLPEWLTTMTALRVLAVQNNNFSGPIPEDLLSANSQIRFTYDGNPFLGNQSDPGLPISEPSESGKSNIGIIAGAGAGGVVGLILITVVAILVYCRCKRKRKLSDGLHSANMRIATPGGAKAYTFAEVTAATNQFRRELGKGGFGLVYYGQLPDGQEVAVKVADGNSKHEERAFFNEVDVLSRVHHKNLVTLVGYCQEQKQILIYEYMHNGSLFDHLHGSSESTGTLNWRMRLNIALNAAQGLEYLHTGCRPSFIHRDVKSSNILLTPQLEAKVADFGLTKLMGDTDVTGVMTNNVMGTAGYLDPEYLTSHYISSKSDVYSFGIVLLELITGCLPIEQSSPNGRDPNIGNWVRDNLHSNNITSILDHAITTSNPNMEAVWKVVDVAIQSVEPKSVHRPTMTEVVQELQGALALEGTTGNVQSTQAFTMRSSQATGFSDYSIPLYGSTSFPTPR